MAKTYKPGEIVPESGIYQPSKGKSDITSVKGERFPPAPKPNTTYEIKVPTPHKKKP